MDEGEKLSDITRRTLPCKNLTGASGPPCKVLPAEWASAIVKTIMLAALVGIDGGCLIRGVGGRIGLMRN